MTIVCTFAKLELTMKREFVKVQIQIGIFFSRRVTVHRVLILLQCLQNVKVSITVTRMLH